jgi:hypothetical protein
LAGIELNLGQKQQTRRIRGIGFQYPIDFRFRLVRMVRHQIRREIPSDVEIIREALFQIEEQCSCIGRSVSGCVNASPGVWTEQDP